MHKLDLSPASRRERLRAKLEAARSAPPPQTVNDEEFRSDVIEAREEYRRALKQGLVPAVDEIHPE